MVHPVPLIVAAALVAGGDPSPAAVRAAVERALPLLAKGAAGHAEQKTCFACHNQAFPAAAFAAARSRGLDVRPGILADQIDHIRDFLDTNRDGYLAGRGTGGQADSAGYALLTLELAGHKPDEVTAAVAEYLLKRDAEKAYWRAVSNRPPSEASHLTTTYLAVRGLKHWSTPAQQERVARKFSGVRFWVVRTRPDDTEDRVYRLRLFAELRLEPDRIRRAVEDLLARQRPDGGWAQLERLASDPYATGSVLAALHEAGGLPTDHPAYRRGLAFLLDTQHADGSWYVKSRSRPFQPYYESGFPHVKDQFISVAASGWAATALALSLPPKPPAAR